MDACACCSHPGSDIRLTGCGCLLHTRCTPLSLVLQHRHVGVASATPTSVTTSTENQHNWTLTPNTATTVYCRFCNSHVPAGIAILPLSFEDLEESITLRVEGKKAGASASAAPSTSSKSTAAASASGSAPGSSSDGTTPSSSSSSTAVVAAAPTASNTKKRDREDSFCSSTSDDGSPAASTVAGTVTTSSLSHSAYIVYSQGRKTFNNNLVSDEDLYRTGRWNDEEVEFVDQLLSLFDSGLLPVTNGTKLASFLGDMLLCKASRLTKKMKNAKLSSRAFGLSPAATMDSSPNMTLQEQMERDRTTRQELSSLQEHFIKSLPSKSAQIEMRFNLAKQWRSYFSNLSVEVEYPHLDVNGWIASLEELEARASDAESQLRNVRRRRMGLSSRTSTTTSSSFTSGSSSVPRPISTQSMAAMSNTSMVAVPSPAGGPRAPLQMTDEDSSNDFDRDVMFLMGEEIADFGVAPAVSAPPKVLSELRDWACCSNPFLEAVSVYLREHHLPFQYVDVWVPSLSDGQPFVGSSGEADEQNQVVSLLPAGYTTRHDEDDSVESTMTAFGEFSKSFSFKPGVGLPGRVYLSGKTAWQKSLNNVPESVFARVAGAKIHGLQTAAAIPFPAPGIGRMILVMYSTQDLPVDWSMLEQCSKDLEKYTPQPKWKLVIELGPPEEEYQQESDFQAIEEMVQDSLEPEPTGKSGGNTPSPSPFQHTSLSPSHIIEPMSDESLEKRLISLLGDQMSHFHPTSNGEATSSADADIRDYLPDIMRIRLLLLRSSEKRSQDDNDSLDVLKSSFKNYVEESKRTDREVATLLAREWQCLKMFSEDTSPSMAPTLPTGLNHTTAANTMPAGNFLPEKYNNQTFESTPNDTGKALVQPYFMTRRPHSISQGDNSLVVHDHTPVNERSSVMGTSGTAAPVSNLPSLVNLPPLGGPASFLPTPNNP